MADAPADAHYRWLSAGVAGIGTASFLADVGHEIPTALLPNLLTATLGAPAAALGLIEGLARRPGRRRPGWPVAPSPTTHAAAAPRRSVAIPPPLSSPA